MKLRQLFLRDLDRDLVLSLLGEWSWALGARQVRPVALSAFGHWFLEDKRTFEILRLDPALGSLQVLAPHRDAWRRACSRHRQEWLLAREHSLLLGRGLVLRAGECFNWKTPPCLGGHQDVSNFEVAMLETQQRGLARLHARMSQREAGDSTATPDAMGSVFEAINAEQRGPLPFAGVATSTAALAAMLMRWASA